ncbi:MAG: hypothetical protein QNJ77_13495 [Acidimicrobiia bacterium]|nr:hypothetical protein [Acidimicrobiia bacterium]
MNDQRVLEKISQTDTYPFGSPMPTEAWSREAALIEIERRLAMKPRTSTRQAPPTMGDAHRAGHELEPGLPPSPSKPTRSGTRAALAAAAAVLVIGVASFGLLRLLDPEPREIPVTGHLTEQALEAFEVVEEAYDAFNSDDAETWVELTWQNDSAGLALNEALLAAEGEAEVTGCTSHGFGEWPDVTIDGFPPAVGYYFSCDVTFTDSFRGPAGVDLVLLAHWVIADGQAQPTEPEPGPGHQEYTAYTSDFRSWLRSTHPEVESRMLFVEADGFPLFPRPTSVPTALEYAEEYAASRSSSTGAPGLPPTTAVPADGTALELEEILGTWSGLEAGTYIRLKDDRTFLIALSVEALETSPIGQGDFELDGARFTWISNAADSGCSEGQRGTYDIERIADGPGGRDQFRWIHVADECAIRGGDGRSVTMQRVVEE